MHYLVAIRMAPIAPHWFINMASPIVKVQLRYYFLGCFLGLLPMNCIAVRAGEKLMRIESLGDLYGTETLVLLALLALLALAPVTWQRMYGDGARKP